MIVIAKKSTDKSSKVEKKSSTIPQWWMNKTYQEQVNYLHAHPKSSLSKVAKQVYKELKPEEQKAVKKNIDSIAKGKAADAFDKALKTPKAKARLKASKRLIGMKLRKALANKSLVHFAAAVAVTVAKVGATTLVGAAAISMGIPICVVTQRLFDNHLEWMFDQWRKNSDGESDDEMTNQLAAVVSNTLRKKLKRKDVEDAVVPIKPKRKSRKAK